MPGRRVVGLIAWPLLSLVVAVLLGWALGAAVDAWGQPDGVREPGPETLLFVAAFPIIIGLGSRTPSGWTHASTAAPSAHPSSTATTRDSSGQAISPTTRRPGIYAS